MLSGGRKIDFRRKKSPIARRFQKGEVSGRRCCGCGERPSAVQWPLASAEPLPPALGGAGAEPLPPAPGGAGGGLCGALAVNHKQRPSQ